MEFLITEPYPQLRKDFSIMGSPGIYDITSENVYLKYHVFNPQDRTWPWKIFGMCLLFRIKAHDLFQALQEVGSSVMRYFW